MTKTTRRKANTALVYNPSRGLSIGGRSTVRRASKTNPSTRRETAAVANPRPKKRTVTRHRRRHNPASTGGWLMASLMTALGASLLDIATGKLLPPTSQLIGAGIKLGIALGIQTYGQKIPVFGQYKSEIALVVGVLGFKDLINLYLLPVVNGFTGNLLQVVPAPAAMQQVDPTLAGIYPSRPYRQAKWA